MYFFLAWIVYNRELLGMIMVNAQKMYLNLKFVANLFSLPFLLHVLLESFSFSGKHVRTCLKRGKQLCLWH